MAVVVWLVLIEALYLRALRVLGRRGVRVPRGQIALWHLGVACQAVAFLSPIGSLADELLSAHMAEHLLMADIGAPLLLAGVRNPVLAFFLPRDVLVPLARRRPPAQAFRTLRLPWSRSPSTSSRSTAGTSRSRSRAPCATTSSTSPSTSASSSPGSLVWWSALEPKRRRLHGDLWKIGHIFSARMLGMFLGMAFVLIRHPVYTGVYGSGDRHGMCALADQQLAGAMMVSLDIMIMVFALAYFFWHAAQQNDRDEAAAAAARLLDGELALHAGLAVAGDGAVERVLAGL